MTYDQEEMKQLSRRLAKSIKADLPRETDYILIICKPKSDDFLGYISSCKRVTAIEILKNLIESLKVK